MKEGAESLGATHTRQDTRYDMFVANNVVRTAQHDTAQHDTAQHCTEPHSTAAAQ